MEIKLVHTSVMNRLINLFNSDTDKTIFERHKCICLVTWSKNGTIEHIFLVNSWADTFIYNIIWYYKIIKILRIPYFKALNSSRISKKACHFIIFLRMNHIRHARTMLNLLIFLHLFIFNFNVATVHALRFKGSWYIYIYIYI